MHRVRIPAHHQADCESRAGLSTARGLKACERSGASQIDSLRALEEPEIIHNPDVNRPRFRGPASRIRPIIFLVKAAAAISPGDS